MIFACYECHREYPCILTFKGESSPPDLCPFGFDAKWVEVKVKQ